MANEDDAERPNGGAGSESRSQVTALEERVARLELELSVLQRQIAAGLAVSANVPRATPVPPPPPLATSPAPRGGATDARRLISQTWVGARYRPPTEAAPDSAESFESRLGSQIFNRIAIVLLLIGTAYFLKLAVDRQWITPTGRVVAGLIAGAGLVVWSERFRHKGFAAFSYSLKALGSGVLYLSLWAAFQLFHLLPAPAALVLMILVTAWNAYMAWAQDSELLAGYALAGGFATPLLISTGGNHEIFLFNYLLAIDLAIIVLVRLKTWPRLLLGAFPLTVMFFIGWYVEFYAASESTITSIFIILFGVAFASIPVRRPAVNPGSPTPRFLKLAIVLEDLLLPIANAAFVALAFYSVLQDSGHHDWLPWVMIMLAAAYLGLMRAPQTRAASAIHLSLAVVLLTIAIPLKASGHWITVSWLVEGLALLWVATRLTPAGVEEVSDPALPAAQSSRVLRPLAAASLLLGFGGICVHLIGAAQVFDLPLLNKGTGTALTGIAVFAVAAWLALRAGINEQGAAKAGRGNVWGRNAMGTFLLIAMTAALLTIRELGTSWFSEYSSKPHLPFRSADFVTALIGLAVFAGVIAVSLRIARERPNESFWIDGAALSMIAFNLVAVLTGVREVEAIWGNSAATADSRLQQALAISAFLMLYGAALLAAGFWKRNSFLRWQALVLLVFTICKTFLYDMRTLSQEYRVVSFLGLGALLMAISFAYQKDLLHLREAEKARSPGTGKDADPEAAK